MILGGKTKKIALTFHLISSIGWLGAVIAFLSLAIQGIRTEGFEAAKACYLSMETITNFVIVPLCLLALATGLIQSLGTKWGLFRHYWIVVKLGITILSTVILFLHTTPISVMAQAARSSSSFAPELYQTQVQLIVASSAAVVALLVAVVLSVFKPQGLTPYGFRKLNELQKQ